MLIINADDLAMTPGANKGIFNGYDNGQITHASIMANGDYFQDAMQGMQDRKKLGLGIHLNLTYGKALINNHLYCNANGEFNLSYTQLLFFKNQNFLKAVEREWEAQIEKVLLYFDTPKTLTHLDSHRHVHLLPHLYPIVIKLAHKYHIKRVRLIKENILSTLMLTKRLNFILNAGIIKYVLLRSFSILNERHQDLYKGIRFYSMVYTGAISSDILDKLKNSKHSYEVMVHPSIIALDKDVKFYLASEKSYRLSPHREKELEAILSEPPTR